VFSLFIMRHGTAESGEGMDDAERSLTDDGVAALERLSAGLVRRGIRFTRVLASPLLRTRQTAETVCRELGLGAPEVCAVLAPGAICSPVLGALREGVRDDARILIVGHMPDVAQLVRQLSGAAVAGFAPGTLAQIDFDGPLQAGAGALQWAATADEVAGWR
jgi:phosphohistidine phosphatase